MCCYYTGRLLSNVRSVCRRAIIIYFLLMGRFIAEIKMCRKSTNNGEFDVIWMYVQMINVPFQDVERIEEI